MVTLSCGRPYVLVACNGGISLGDVRVKSCCKTSARSQNTSFREQLTKSLTSLFSCSIHFVHCVVCILGYFRTVLNSFTVHNSLRSKSHEHTDLLVCHYMGHLIGCVSCHTFWLITISVTFLAAYLVTHFGLALSQTSS